MLKIHNLNMDEYREKFLNSYPKISHDMISTSYRVSPNDLTDGGILKDYAMDQLIPEFKEDLLNMWANNIRKISLINDFDELPNFSDLIFVDGQMRGYISEDLERKYVDFEKYISFEAGHDLTEIVELFKKVKYLTERGIDEKLVFNNLPTPGILKIDPETLKLKISSIEGIQFGKAFPYVVDNILGISVNREFTRAYLKTHDTINRYLDYRFNRAIFLIWFIKVTTGLCMPLGYPSYLPMKMGREIVLDKIGLKEDDIIAPYIREMFSKNIERKIPDDYLEALAKVYTLVPHKYDGESDYSFVRKYNN